MNKDALMHGCLLFLMSMCTNDALASVVKLSDINLGNSLYVNDTITTKITIANESAASFRIDRVKLSCSCISTTFSTQAIPAGDSTEIGIVLRAPAKAGPFSYRAIIHTITTEKDIKTYVQTLKGKFRSPTTNLVISPYNKLSFMGMFPEERDSRYISITRVGRGDVGMIEVQISEDYITAIKTPKSKPDNLRFRIITQAPSRIGPHSASIVFRGKKSDEDFITVNVKTFVLDPIIVRPTIGLMTDSKQNFSFTVYAKDFVLRDLAHHAFETPGGLKIEKLKAISLNPDKQKIDVSIRAINEGYVSGTLTLNYPGISDPIQWKIVGMN